MNKKVVIILIAIIVAVLVIAGIVIGVKTKDIIGESKAPTSSQLSISTVEDMEELVEDLQSATEGYRTVTTQIDLTDENSVQYATGLTSTDKIEAIVTAEPMISSQAYSLVLVKVKDASYADSIAKEMNEKADANKWVCVFAEKVYTTSSGNIVCLVMSAEDIAKPVYEKFKDLAGEIGEEYIRDNGEGIVEGFDFDAQPAV